MALIKSNRPPQIKASKGDYVIDWIETHCVYTVGRWVGQQVKLLEWQKDFLRHLFAIDPETKRRWYRWALLGIPKKNGKTELAAWLGLYFLIGDNEPAAWVACAASSDNQADLVFGAAKRCAEWSPTLSKVCVTYDREILVPSLPGAKLVRVTSGTGTNDGPSWHAVICDELHEWVGKGEDLWSILTNGIGGREQPVVLQITTAGFDVEGTVCGQQYEWGKQLVREPDLDPHYLMWWYEPVDPKCDYRDEEVWRDVTPSWGVAIPDPIKYLRDQALKKTESVFRRYFLNQWVRAEDIWLPYEAWESCIQEDRDLSRRYPLYVGVDGALRRDSMALVAYQPQPVTELEELQMRALAEEHGFELPEMLTRDVVRSWIFENPYPKRHPKHGNWKLNLHEPKNVLRELFRDFPEVAMYDEDDEPLVGPAFGYDPYALELFASDLEDEGLNMVEVPQTPQRMCPASETLYEKILTQIVAHDNDPTLDRHIHSAVPKESDRGWRIVKPKDSPGVKVDGAIALAMAAHLAHLAMPEASDGFEIY